MLAVRRGFFEVTPDGLRYREAVRTKSMRWADMFEVGSVVDARIEMFEFRGRGGSTLKFGMGHWVSSNGTVWSRAVMDGAEAAGVPVTAGAKSVASFAYYTGGGPRDARWHADREELRRLEAERAAHRKARRAAGGQARHLSTKRRILPRFRAR